MKDATVSLPTPVKKLIITEAPCRELCNFLIYRQNPEILNERARWQPALQLHKIPANVWEVGEILGAEKCEKRRKLYFDCADSENHRGILIHNFNAQFWVHYFRCGIGLVNVSCFSQLATAEGSVLPTMTRTVADSYEYQWFIHDLTEKYFKNRKPEIFIGKLAKYFVEQVNPNLISPYSVHSEDKQITEQYKFVQGSLENLKEILKQAMIVCEALKRVKDANEKCYVSPYLTITCGSLRQPPSLEHSSEPFLNQVGALALKENVPFSLLTENHFRRVENSNPDLIRKNKYHLYLNFQEAIQNSTPREKIAAKFHLINWLKKQGREGNWIIKVWKLESVEKFESFPED
jgi:hypothetical protein